LGEAEGSLKDLVRFLAREGLKPLLLAYSQGPSEEVLATDFEEILESLKGVQMPEQTAFFRDEDLGKDEDLQEFRSLS